MTGHPEFLDGKLTKGIGPVFAKPLDAGQIAEHIRAVFSTILPPSSAQ